MRSLRPSSEDEMIAVFLRAEARSSRHRPRIERALAASGAAMRIVDEPDVLDSGENDVRYSVLAQVRGYRSDGLFGGFPSDVGWEWAVLDRDELLAVRYILHDYWVELSGGTRLATDAARRIREGVEVFGVANDGFLELADQLASGERFDPLIVVEGPDVRVLLEGHARLTAYAFAPPESGPEEMEVLLGRSPGMSGWALL